MNQALSQDARTLVDSVAAFAREQLGGDVDRHDAAGEFNWEGWRKCAQFGILGLPFPEEHGGGGVDRFTAVLAMEALARGCADGGLVFSMNAHIWACALPIWKFGSPEQRTRHLPRLARGEAVGAFAATEPDSGSDVNSLRTRASRTDGGYRLSGTKTFVTNAPIADLLLVLATVDPAKGAGGITAFLIEKGTPGLSVGRDIPKMGLRTSPMGEVVLDDCAVGPESRLGAEGGALGLFHTVMEWERSCLLASQVGLMTRQLDQCVRYARTRRQFGQAIGKFQQVSARIADMKIRLNASRALLYSVAASSARGSERLMEVAAAKVFISEAAVQSGLDAVQIHGGYGYAAEGGVERQLRDAVGGRIYSGTNEIQKTIIARCLGL